MMMIKKTNILAAFLAELAGVVLALAVCQEWLVAVVDHLSGFWRTGERHDYLKPGEGLLLLVSCCLCVAGAILLALLALHLVFRRSVSKKEMLIPAAPSALAGLMIFHYLVAPLIPASVILSVEGISLFTIGGAALGTFLFSFWNSRGAT